VHTPLKQIEIEWSIFYSIKNITNFYKSSFFMLLEFYVILRVIVQHCVVILVI